MTRRIISSLEELDRENSVFEVGSFYRKKLEAYTISVYKTGFPVVFDYCPGPIGTPSEEDCIAFGPKSKWSGCSTCSTLYLSKGKNSGNSFLDNPGIILGHTEHGVYIAPRYVVAASLNKRSPSIIEKMNRIVRTTLLYGMGLAHTEISIDPRRHLRSQISLLLDAYGILRTGSCYDDVKIKLTTNGELILYLELSNPVEKAALSQGEKITHPHVWIRTFLPTYGSPRETIYFEANVTVPEFITETTTRASCIYILETSSKVYVKYYIDQVNYDVKRCEIDVEVVTGTN